MRLHEGFLVSHGLAHFLSLGHAPSCSVVPHIVWHPVADLTWRYAAQCQNLLAIASCSLLSQGQAQRLWCWNPDRCQQGRPSSSKFGSPGLNGIVPACCCHPQAISVMDEVQSLAKKCARRYGGVSGRTLLTPPATPLGRSIPNVPSFADWNRGGESALEWNPLNSKRGSEIDTAITKHCCLGLSARHWGALSPSVPSFVK